jgi:hypothetical protein
MGKLGKCVREESQPPAKVIRMRGKRGESGPVMCGGTVGVEGRLELVRKLTPAPCKSR